MFDSNQNFKKMLNENVLICERRRLKMKESRVVESKSGVFFRLMLINLKIKYGVVEW